MLQVFGTFAENEPNILRWILSIKCNEQKEIALLLYEHRFISITLKPCLYHMRIRQWQV